MKKILLFLSATFCMATVGQAQKPAPGGVEGMRIWCLSERSPDGATYWHNRVSGLSTGLPAKKNALPAPANLNYNPALPFDDTHEPINLDLGQRDFSQSTFFTVAYPSDTLSEKSIWSLEANQNSRLLLTTHRMADLLSFRYMNFVDKRKDLPAIHTYQQFVEKDSVPPAQQTLRIGLKPEGREIPISAFKGVIPELIGYDRVLTPEERLRVESYLALKYGLTLQGPDAPVYLNSAGETIWNGNKYPAFSFNMAGIGRDDASGLYQKQASNSETPGLLSIGIGQIAPSNAENPTALNNNSFLIWGDNKQSLRPGKKPTGQPQPLMRQWLLASSGPVPDLPASLTIDTRQIRYDLEPGETWWLLIDRSAGGQFPAGKTEYIKVSSIDAKGLATFNDIHWDSDHSGADLFTLAIGPAWMPVIWFRAPLCSPQTPGAITLGAVGGKMPYRFSLTSQESGLSQQWEAAANDLRTIRELLAGEYQLSISDAAGASYRESFFVQSADAPKSGLADQYLLPSGQTLKLDASVRSAPAGLSYQWQSPKGETNFSPTLSISEPGTYRLIIDNGSCQSRQVIEVLKQQTDPFKRAIVYPNPAPRGRFQLEVDLFDQAPVEAVIYDLAGKVVWQRQLSGDTHYLLAGALNTPGEYLIALRSGQLTQSLKLVVK